MNLDLADRMATLARNFSTIELLVQNSAHLMKSILQDMTSEAVAPPYPSPLSHERYQPDETPVRRKPLALEASSPPVSQRRGRRSNESNYRTLLAQVRDHFGNQPFTSMEVARLAGKLGYSQKFQTGGRYAFLSEAKKRGWLDLDHETRQYTFPSTQVAEATQTTEAAAERPHATSNGSVVKGGVVGERMKRAAEMRGRLRAFLETTDKTVITHADTRRALGAKFSQESRDLIYKRMNEMEELGLVKRQSPGLYEVTRLRAAAAAAG